MASSIFRSFRRSMTLVNAPCIKDPSSSTYLLKIYESGCSCNVYEKLVLTREYSNNTAQFGNESEGSERSKGKFRGGEEEAEDFPREGISKPISEVLKQLNKKVPTSLISVRSEDGFSVKYIPWHVVNRILNLHAPEWSGEVRSITYSPDGKSVSVVYRVTLYGTDAEIFRESSGTVCLNDKGFGDAVQKAEAMAFRRACARFGLGLHLYHEDLS